MRSGFGLHASFIGNRCKFFRSLYLIFQARYGDNYRQALMQCQARRNTHANKNGSIGRWGMAGEHIGFKYDDSECPSRNRQIWSRSRRAKNLTAGIGLIFRGLYFSRNADTGQIGHLWMGTSEVFICQLDRVRMSNEGLVPFNITRLSTKPKLVK